MRAGEAARRIQVTVRALRYYESMGPAVPPVQANVPGAVAEPDGTLSDLMVMTRFHRQ